jgi:MSHA biogenesis protein MshQ
MRAGMQVALDGDMADTHIRFWPRIAKLFVLACGLLLCTSHAMAASGVVVTAATGGTAISADATGGTYTALTGPTITEDGPAGIKTIGTIILNAPSGFIFDIGSNVTATVSSCTGNGSNTLVGNSPGSSSQTVTPTTNTITINIFQVSSGSVKCTLTWSNIRVRPTSGTPLASGNITRSGGATMAENPATTNYGTLTEVIGAANRLAYGVQPSNTAAGASISPAVTVVVQDQFGNTVTSNTSSISLAIGTNPGSGTLNGTISVAAVAGVATFSTLSINNAGTGYTLFASATNLTGATSAAFNITAPVSGFDAVEVGAARATNIYTKLAGTAFSLDILALNSSNNIATTYAGTVSVKLVDATTGGGVCGSMTTLQDFGSFSSFSSGRKTVTLTYANAARNAKIRINDATAGVTSCSTDGFSIRPTQFTSVTSTMTNTGTSSTPSAIAGSGNFTLTADTGLSGYDGTPKIDNTGLQAHTGAIQNGAVTGVFSAASSGAATGASFTYSEVGNFHLIGSTPFVGDTVARGVYDDTFTSVDGSDCTNDFSNTLSGGKYGCKFGITANSSYFGRFFPASFVLTASSVTPACSAVSGFSYMGQSFTVTANVQALNGATTPALTKNYDGTFAPGVAVFAAENSNNGTDLSSRLTIPAGAWAAGVYTLNTAAATFSRPVTTTSDATWGPYGSLLVGIRISDSDGPVISSKDMDPTTTGSCVSCSYKTMGSAMAMRMGRLQMQNAHGSELLNLPIPLEAQYWNGSAYVRNASDSCTTIPASSLIYSGFQSNLAACETYTFMSSAAMSVGRASLSLTKPGNGNSGSVNLAVNVGSTASGSTCTSSSSSSATAAGMAWFGTNPSAKATFGIHKTPLIYLRENF